MPTDEDARLAKHRKWVADEARRQLREHFARRDKAQTELDYLNHMITFWQDTLTENNDGE